MLIIGHRGAGAYTPHNSRQSFSQAIAMGAHMIETDIRVTKDKVPVLCHDAQIPLGLIEELTWQQLKNYPLANGELIPSLEEMLELFATKISFNLEIKPTCLSNIEPIMCIIKKFQMHKSLYSSFSLPIVSELSKYGETALLLEDKLEPQEILKQLTACHAKTLNLYYPLVNSSLSEMLESNSIKLIVWTDFITEIWDPLPLYQMAFDHNAYGFITGKPDRLSWFLKASLT